MVTTSCSKPPLVMLATLAAAVLALVSPAAAGKGGADMSCVLQFDCAHPCADLLAFVRCLEGLCSQWGSANGEECVAAIAQIERRCGPDHGCAVGSCDALEGCGAEGGLTLYWIFIILGCALALIFALFLVCVTLIRCFGRRWRSRRVLIHAINAEAEESHDHLLGRLLAT